MGVANLMVTPELLRDMLHLPADCEIIGEPYVRLLVDHPDIPAEAVEVSALFTSSRLIDGRTVTEFQKWEMVRGRPKSCEHCAGTGKAP
jgi:hypothetical protein